jgi:hypothetical protein
MSRAFDAGGASLKTHLPFMRISAQINRLKLFEIQDAMQSPSIVE